MDQTYQYQSQDDFEISVEVTDPKVKEGVAKHVTYSVRGIDKLGQFDVTRRYNDFFAVRQVLVIKWPGCFIPPLPPKKALGNMDEKFIDDRMKYLNEFLRKIATAKYFWYSEEFQIFVRSQSGDVEKTLQTVPKVTNDEIINKYQNTFHELSGKEINMQILNKIAEFNLFLKRVTPMVENFKQIAKNINKAKSEQQQSILTLIDALLPDYEKNLLLEYVGGKEDKLILTQSCQDQNLQNVLLAYKQVMERNEFNILYEQIRLESKELEAFQETFAQRAKYEKQKEEAQTKQKELQIELQQVLAGKTTFKSLFSKGSKEETIQKLQSQIDQSNKDIDNTSFICDILTVLLGYIEIDRFKQEKQLVYYAMMKRIILFEIARAKITQEFWEKIQQNYYLI